MHWVCVYVCAPPRRRIHCCCPLAVPQLPPYGSFTCGIGNSSSTHFMERDNSAHMNMLFDVDAVLDVRHSALQTAEMLQLPRLGKVLVLDGVLQFAQADEANYHEMMVHVPMAHVIDQAVDVDRATGSAEDVAVHAMGSVEDDDGTTTSSSTTSSTTTSSSTSTTTSSSTSTTTTTTTTTPHGLRVLIVGGGDGAALHRVVQYHDVVAVDLVDLDPMVPALCRAHFPLWDAAFRDPRVTTHFGSCGAAWVAKRAAGVNPGTPLYDVVLVDATDFGVARPLFTNEFYQGLHRLLAPSGVLVANVDSPSWSLHAVQAVSAQLSTIFRHAFVYQVHQPSFASGHYSFAFASDAVHPLRNAPNAGRRWSARGIPTRYFHPDLLQAAFILPKFADDVVKHKARLPGMQER